MNTPEGLTTQEGLNLAGSSDPGWTAVGDEADRLSQLRASGAETECCSIRKDCQEPPDADPHVRWCGSWGEQSPQRPDFGINYVFLSTIMQPHPSASPPTDSARAANVASSAVTSRCVGMICRCTMACHISRSS